MGFDGNEAAREYEEYLARTANWTRAAKLAYERESLQKMLWTFRPAASIRSLSRVLRQQLPARIRLLFPDREEPEEFRPSFPNYLYVLAQEARNGGKYSDYVVFLRALDLEASGDSIIAADERLRITFEPKGPNTRAWWFDASDRARAWLRHQLVKPNTGPDASTPELNPELISPEDKHKALHKVLEPELHEFMVRELLHRTLPQRQAEVMWLYIMFHDPDKPRETTAAIAEYLRISPATVRWHKAQALQNPQLRKIWRRG